MQQKVLLLSSSSFVSQFVVGSQVHDKATTQPNATKGASSFFFFFCVTICCWISSVWQSNHPTKCNKRCFFFFFFFCVTICCWISSAWQSNNHRAMQCNMLCIPYPTNFKSPWLDYLFSCYIHQVAPNATQTIPPNATQTSHHWMLVGGLYTITQLICHHRGDNQSRGSFHSQNNNNSTLQWFSHK